MRPPPVNIVVVASATKVAFSRGHDQIPTVSIASRYSSSDGSGAGLIGIPEILDDTSLAPTANG